MWVLVATTGMRRSELAGAVRRLVDLDKRTLTKADTRVVVGGKAEDSDGKTASSNHTIALDVATVDYLRRHLAMLDQQSGTSARATTIADDCFATRTALHCTPKPSPAGSTDSSTGPASNASAYTTSDTHTRRSPSPNAALRRKRPRLSGSVLSRSLASIVLSS
jgi:hypothetical protein